MMQLRWTEPAREDLRQIHGFIARDSSAYATRLIMRIEKAVDGVRRFPLAASRVAEWDRDDLREIFVASYRVIFRVAETTIEIITVIHSARELPDSFRE